MAPAPRTEAQAIAAMTDLTARLRTRGASNQHVRVCIVRDLPWVQQRVYRAFFLAELPLRHQPGGGRAKNANVPVKAPGVPQERAELIRARVAASELRAVLSDSGDDPSGGAA